MDNSIANHLSRMQITDMQDLPINDFLRDDMLLKVTDSTPWYVNIVNFMVAGYVPLGENKKKLIYESRCHLWDNPYLYRVCADGLLCRCVPTTEGIKIIEQCHAARMEDTTVYFVRRPRTNRVNYTSQPCMKTQKNSFEDATDARNMVGSRFVMRCP